MWEFINLTIFMIDKPLISGDKFLWDNFKSSFKSWIKDLAFCNDLIKHPVSSQLTCTNSKFFSPMCKDL